MAGIMFLIVAAAIVVTVGLVGAVQAVQIYRELMFE
jgi:hypothetical protein